MIVICSHGTESCMESIGIVYVLIILNRDDITARIAWNISGISILILYVLLILISVLILLVLVSGWILVLVHVWLLICRCCHIIWSIRFHKRDILVWHIKRSRIILSKGHSRSAQSSKKRCSSNVFFHSSFLETKRYLISCRAYRIYTPIHLQCQKNFGVQKRPENRSFFEILQTIDFCFDDSVVSIEISESLANKEKEYPDKFCRVW